MMSLYSSLSTFPGAVATLINAEIGEPYLRKLRGDFVHAFCWGVEDKLELDSPLKYRSHGVYNVDEGMLYVITHNSLMSASTVGELYWPPIDALKASFPLEQCYSSLLLHHKVAREIAHESLLSTIRDRALRLSLHAFNVIPRTNPAMLNFPETTSQGLRNTSSVRIL
ncbi:Uncharacterized protein HZ326_2291 [Fusarium oxysporum f. sp. albedinis]|nr:Uncharacterized protein HZ326_2291 [Fusarium oxysporum f. sp. albedinis]